MLDLCHCTQLVSHAPGVIPGLGQPLPFHPCPLDLDFIQTLTWRRPGLDNKTGHLAKLYKILGPIQNSQFVSIEDTGQNGWLCESTADWTRLVVQLNCAKCWSLS